MAWAVAYFIVGGILRPVSLKSAGSPTLSFLLLTTASGLGGRNLVIPMCIKLKTEYLICEIADYTPGLQNRSALICKRTDEAVTFYAFIQKVQVINLENQVVLWPCDEKLSKFTEDPFFCELPVNTTFETLSVGDILMSVLF